jgi:hypothetical protein
MSLQKTAESFLAHVPSCQMQGSIAIFVALVDHSSLDDSLFLAAKQQINKSITYHRKSCPA